MFWTDAVQAQERLQNSVVNYDGKPFSVDEIVTRTKDGDPKPCAYGRLLDRTKDRVLTIPLEDEKWKDFRDLPKLGWFNYITGEDRLTTYYLERRAVNTRTHGLRTDNVRAFGLIPEGVTAMRAYDLVDFFRNPAYQETCKDEANYPKLSQILMSLDETPSGAAFSSKFAVVVTSEGMKWLYRKTKRIGFFTGTDSLNLFPSQGFYKEELQACPSFDINNIKEF